MNFFRESCYWIAAGILTLMPLVLAIDFGGVLRWTQYMAALAVIVPALLTAIAWLSSRDRGQARQHVLLVPLLLWVVAVWLQTIPLPGAIVKWLSPGSASAYTTWIEPYFTAAELPRFFPVSVSVTETRHSLAMLCVIVAVVWCSAIVFNSRVRIGMLLSGLALAGACVTALGLSRLVFPDAPLFGYEEHLRASGFGMFINRNNAALMLNLGLACSLGLLSWRLTALTGIEVDDPEFEFNDLLSLISDRQSFVGVISAALCVSGLLVNGSRGGVVAAMMGFLLAFGWVRQRRGLVSYPVIATVIALCVAVLLVPTNLSLESIKRLEFLASENQQTLLNDGRLLHWPDGLRAAAAYFPSGAGLGTYGDAVLPYQQTSAGSGFHHADNLWVELVTEQSIWGLVLALSILLLVIRSLSHMADSPDPIDQGLRITGWFTVTAIVVSQFFDFGLILPANLFAVALLLPTIIARDVAAGTSRELEDADFVVDADDDRDQNELQESTSTRQRSRKRYLFDGRRTLPWLLASAAIPLVLLPLALWRLHADAEIEVFKRGLVSQLAWVPTDDDALEQWIDRLSAHEQTDSSPITQQLLSEVAYYRAQLHDVAEQSPASRDEAIKMYRETSPARRRLQWLRSRAKDESTVGAGGSVTATAPTIVAGQPVNSNDWYRKSLEHSNAALRLRPLSNEARPYQVYLDFVHQDRKRTHLAIEQLSRLYFCEPASLISIAILAADGSDNELAINILKTAISSQPSLTATALAQAERHGIEELGSIVPASSQNYRATASYLLTQRSTATELLAEAYAGLSCDTCKTQSERAACEQLAGDIAFRLERLPESFERYQTALKYDPTNATMRLTLISRLRQDGQRREALSEARRARLIIPGDDRFTTQIEEMAAEDINAVESQ